MKDCDLQNHYPLFFVFKRFKIDWPIIYYIIDEFSHEDSYINDDVLSR